MERMRRVYKVQLPMEGHPVGYYTLCRALQPEGVAAVIAALLSVKDKGITEVRVIVAEEFVDVEDKT